MGQAKDRGTRDERIAGAAAVAAAGKPPRITCNSCGVALPEAEALDASALTGIGAAYRAHCDACDQDTWAVRGEPKAVRAFYEALEKVAGAKVQLGATKPTLSS